MTKNPPSPFKPAFLKKFTTDKAKKYYLPIHFVQKHVQQYENLGKDILNVSDRILIEHSLAIYAVTYHNGRIER